METWSVLISNVGYPIVSACALAFALWQMWKLIKTTCDKLTETNAELVKTNGKLTETNGELVKTNSNLVSSINAKLDKLMDEFY